MVAMLCDHANFLVIRRGVFAPYTAADGSILIPADAPAGVLLVQRVYGIFEILGHIGFPIFIFLLTEGFLHPRSRKRYLLTALQRPVRWSRLELLLRQLRLSRYQVQPDSLRRWSV